MDARVLTISGDSAAPTALDCFMFRRRALAAVPVLLGLGLAVLPQAAGAQDWQFSTLANISATMGVNAGRLCLGEGSRQDIGCPTYAPFVSSAGNVGIGTTSPSSTLHVAGWASADSFMLPNGGALFGKTSGGAQVPLAFMWTDNDAYFGNTSGSVIFRAASNGYTERMRIDATTGNVGIGTANPNATLEVAGTVSATQFRGDGSLLTGISSQGDRITSGTTSVVAMTASSFVSVTQSGTNTAWFDPTRGLVTLGVSATGIISASAFRTPGAISASVISATAIQLVSQSTTPVACNTGNAGTLRYNSPTTSLELCTGSGWQPMGVGIPAGTISAFASTTCPVGWSEYTPARGRFMRGIDNGAGNDPAGTRSPGATQGDAYQAHHHVYYGNTGTGTTGGGFGIQGSASVLGSGLSAINQFGLQTSSSGDSTETRPKNVAVTFCQFNGTSNGWNNPLSGGSGGTPAGSTGQVQFNTAGSFDASANLTWDNAASRLTATNISATAVTVAGRVSASVVQIGDDGAGCTTGTLGTIRRDPATGKFQICRM